MLMLTDWFDYLLDSYLGGFILIGIGLFMIWFVKKNPQTEPSPLSADIKASAGAVFAILGGMTLIIAKALGKL